MRACERRRDGDIDQGRFTTEVNAAEMRCRRGGRLQAGRWARSRGVLNGCWDASDAGAGCGRASAATPAMPCSHR